MMKKEIYILEDDDGIREMIHYLLQNNGYEVFSFPSVRAFNERMQGGSPDLVILDIWLPDGDGRVICKELRSKDATAELPIVMMTASTELNGIDEADEFITKPFDIDDLMNRIKNLLAS